MAWGRRKSTRDQEPLEGEILEPERRRPTAPVGASSLVSEVAGRPGLPDVPFLPGRGGWLRSALWHTLEYWSAERAFKAYNRAATAGVECIKTHRDMEVAKQEHAVEAMKTANIDLILDTEYDKLVAASAEAKKRREDAERSLEAARASPKEEKAVVSEPVDPYVAQVKARIDRSKGTNAALKKIDEALQRGEISEKQAKEMRHEIEEDEWRRHARR